MDAAHPGRARPRPPPLYAGLDQLSPWIDARWMGPIEMMLANVEAQTASSLRQEPSRADGLRYFPQAKYIVVGRDTRDVFMSLFNHYSAYTEFMYAC